MTEEDAFHKLYAYYTLTKSKRVKSMPKEQFVEYHKLQVRRLNKRYWVEPDAKQYIDQLKVNL